MTHDMQLELWRQLITFSNVVSIALGLYIAKRLHRMMRDLDARASDNSRRDKQRDEVQENVRRIANGLSVHSADPETRPVDVAGAIDERAINAAAITPSDKRSRARESLEPWRHVGEDDSQNEVG